MAGKTGCAGVGARMNVSHLINRQWTRVKQKGTGVKNWVCLINHRFYVCSLFRERGLFLVFDVLLMVDRMGQLTQSKMDMDPEYLH